MPRLVLDEANIDPFAMRAITNFHSKIVGTVSETVKKDRVVVVGMAHNPFVKKARKVLEEAGIDFTYLEFGSYFSEWKPRLAIKLWSGWPTYPQVFVGGKLIGGFQETKAKIESGELKKSPV